jgi:two-component SAPR family response regulator
MVHLGGAVTGGDVLVDLEAVGALSVQSPHADAILRHVAASLAVSPFLEAARVFTVGLGEVGLGSPNSEQVDSFDAAVDAALMSAGSTAQLAHGATTFAMRAGGVGGEAWEPAVVVAATDETAPMDRTVARALAGGRGLAVVADIPMEGDWQLTATDGCHVLEPLGLSLQPVGLEEADVAAVHDLLTAPMVLPPEPLARVTSLTPAEREPFVERAWALRVGLFGAVEVVSRDGVAAQCERSKAVELVAWLGQHRDRPTRSAARTALWDVEVRDATFANVVSDARRAMARAVAPPEGEEWISRTLTDDLPLHPLVVTDGELLADRVAGAQGRAPLDAIEVLRPGVALLAGMPFAGTGYLWPDAEGSTSSLVLLATSAAIELANHYLTLGDVEGVFWASGQGLKVLSGHEELIALRMRAHARRGDLAGVRSEWESYERAIAADPWATGEPAPKLVALRRELLSTNPTPDAEPA